MQIILALIITLVIFAILFYVWYIIWWYNSDNQCEDEIINLKKEISWWKRQNTYILNENSDLKYRILNLNSDIEKANKERDEYEELLQKYTDRYWPYKWTIEETYKAQIIQLYKEWKTYKEIASAIGCWKSTIQRAVAKRWLKR